MVQVTMHDSILTFGELQSFVDSATMLKQRFMHDEAAARNGKTGSWEKLLKTAHIRHKKGPAPALIASGIADFIGLWACATGDVSTIGECLRLA